MSLPTSELKPTYELFSKLLGLAAAKRPERRKRTGRPPAKGEKEKD